jgi:hypothetical protein
MRYTPRTRIPTRHEMQDRTSSTDLRTVTSKHVRASAAASRLIRSAQPAFHPCTLGLLLLALAVALFSYGYKASLYRFEAHQTTHFPVAKALVEHRDGYAAKSFHRPRHRGRLQLEVIPDSYIARVVPSTPVLSFTVCRISVVSRALPFYDIALPLRSPPIFAA